MFKLHEIGDKDYYTISQRNLEGKKLSYADYLSINNERKPEFIGKLAEEYGLLNKDFDNEDFSKLYDGYKPNGDKAIKGAGTPQHQAGKEMCLTLPKSLSVLYAVADEDTRKQIMEVIHSSTDEVMKEVEQLLMPSNQGSNYRKNLETDKTEMICSKFTHYENRDLDPHLHVHVQIFNQAKFYYKDKEPKIQAIDTQKLYQHQKELTQKVNSLIINRLKDIGIKTTEDINNDFSYKIAGIPDEVSNKFSDRSHEVKAWEKENKLKFNSTADRDKAYRLEQCRKVTAKDKKELSYNEIMNTFKDKLDKVDFNFEKFKELNNSLSIENYKNEIELFTKFNDLEIIKKIEDRLILTEGSFTRTKFNEVFISEFKHDIQIQDLKSLNKTVDNAFDIYSEKMKVIEVDKNKKIYTTERVFNTERNIVEISKKLSQTNFEIDKEVKQQAVSDFKKYLIDNNFKLNSGQVEACRLILNGNKSIVSITGDAGTGKTTTAIKFANDLHKNTNSVYGLATAGKISKALQEADIKNTNNIQEFLTNYEKGLIKFDKPPTLIIDEAGMVSSNHMNKLLQITEKYKGNIILVGDPKQLEAVEYGCSLININNNISEDNQSRLITNMRQKNDLAKNIAESFRDKEVNRAFDLLKDNKLLHTDKTQDKVFDKLVNDYFDDKNLIANKLIIAKDNSVVNKLNDKVRNKLFEDNILKNDNQIELQVKIGSNKFAEGRYFTDNDRIVINKKTRIDKNTVLENGTMATITSIDKNTNVLTLSINQDGIDKTINLDPNKHNNFNHSYCQTAHKSQGQTVNNAYVFSTGQTTSNQSYVEFSRHKDNVNLYLVEGTEADFKRNSKISNDKFNAYENTACKDYYKNVVEPRTRAEKIAIRSAEMKLEKENKLETKLIKEIEKPKAIEVKNNEVVKIKYEYSKEPHKTPCRNFDIRGVEYQTQSQTLTPAHKQNQGMKMRQVS